MGCSECKIINKHTFDEQLILKKSFNTGETSVLRYAVVL